ncbi:MAG: hypothetical protein QOI60_686, partial [Actinomycetota bacterium]|nr:hypothetical protein [Actinomycetota bacterium]
DAASNDATADDDDLIPILHALTTFERRNGV